jgi:hypothetical protein
MLDWWRELGRPDSELWLGSTWRLTFSIEAGALSVPDLEPHDADFRPDGAKIGIEGEAFNLSSIAKAAAF